MKKIAAAVILFVFGLLCFAADTGNKNVLNLEDILASNVTQELRKEFKLSRMAIGDDALQLTFFPKTGLGKKALSVWDGEKPPYFTGEQLYLIRKQTTENDLEAASLVFRAISTMEGIQYYSNTRRRVETLYPFCYMIDNPDSKNRIPDVLGVVEDKQYYFYQKDASLGKCIYTINFSQTDTEISNLSTNIDPIKIFLLTAVKKQNLKTYIVISDVGTDFLMYVLVQSVFSETQSIVNIMTKSFSSRADALAAWFNDNYQQAR
jgi:hypothetical protein